ncbi:MAG: ABC transporter ATP-binding protein [Desulfurococcales archaeon]|nr:ABC transporter ATP-binding protein [Desulfurococcales archaeon]
MARGDPLILMEGVEKRFGDVVALRGVDFEVNKGEVVGLLGENGAGKTTLMNILYGLYRMDRGSIYVEGRRVNIRSPADAISHGIFMVHQHFKLVGNFTVLENIVLGTAGIPGSLKPARLESARARLEELMKSYGLRVEADAKVRDLPVGAQQKVEILKALYRGAKLLILDEPTTNLTPQEVDALFESIRGMVARGMSVVFITHKIREALDVADRIVVLRSGLKVGVLGKDEASEERLVKMMVGERLDPSKSLILRGSSPASGARRAGDGGEEVLRVDGVSLLESGTYKLRRVSLSVRRGEILGIAGVSGNGQRELAEVIMGIRRPSEGRVVIAGRDVTGAPTSRILEMGVSYVPEDRIVDGILPTLSVAENIVLGIHRAYSRGPLRVMDYNSVREHAREAIRAYGIVAPSELAVAGRLSGGNIQKLLIARALLRKPRVLVAHNMTRGLDIATTDFVLKRVMELRDEGVGVLYISEDLDELMIVSDRIAVMYRGTIMGVLERREFDKYSIGRLMAGIGGG